MKYLLAFILLFQIANAESYKIQVTRSEQDIYVDSLNNVIVLTENCYHYGYSENSILIYQQYSYENKIIFPNGTSCKVKSAYEN